MEEKCPICGDIYSEKDPEINYHVEYKPVQITTGACNGCNYAEYLMRHPDKEIELERKGKYFMKKRIEKVRDWTRKNEPLIK